MAAMMVAWLVARYRIRQIKKFQYLRTRIASDLHDDVGSFPGAHHHIGGCH